MPYLDNLAPYLMSFSLGQNKNGIPDVFNISMGYDDITLYCLNADETRIKEDLKNKKFRQDLNINKMFREKSFFNRPFSKKRYDRDIEEVYKALVTYKKTFEANEKSLATALDKELDKKDFIIVQSAGNSNKIIQKLEHDYGLNINHTSYFIPIWILTTGNLWGGFELSYTGLAQVWAVLSMVLVGYIEEIIFRGFLFQRILAKDGAAKAIVIVSVTFGIGHIVNLLAGQANLETLLQVVFAIAWGFLFTSIVYKSKSLLPCILAHGMVNAFSKFGQESVLSKWGYIFATILVAAIY